MASQATSQWNASSQMTFTYENKLNCHLFFLSGLISWCSASRELPCQDSGLHLSFTLHVSRWSSKAWQFPWITMTHTLISCEEAQILLMKKGEKTPQYLKSFLSTAYVWFWLKMEQPLCMTQLPCLYLLSRNCCLGSLQLRTCLHCEHKSVLQPTPHAFTRKILP